MKKEIYLEHANITVNSINESIKFFTTAFPNFSIRGEGVFNGRRWVHLGNDDTYLALNEPIENNLKVKKDYVSSGINHIGFVVNDVSELANRLLHAGYVRDYPKQVERFRIRDYFADSDGNQFEFVEYLSEVPEERNLYA